MVGPDQARRRDGNSDLVEIHFVIPVAVAGAEIVTVVVDIAVAALGRWKLLGG